MEDRHGTFAELRERIENILVRHGRLEPLDEEPMRHGVPRRLAKTAAEKRRKRQLATIQWAKAEYERRKRESQNSG